MRGIGAATAWVFGQMQAIAAASSGRMTVLWDDDWTCIGGPAALVGRFLSHPDLEARQVALGQDATPPGHQAF